MRQTARQDPNNVCYPLQEDPELAEAIEPEQRTAATLVTLILSLCVLALLAMPLTWRRIALVVK